MPEEIKVERKLTVGEYYWEVGEGGHRSGNIVKIRRLYIRDGDKRPMAEVDILNRTICKVCSSHHIPICNINLTRNVDVSTVNTLRLKIIKALDDYCSKTKREINVF